MACIVQAAVTIQLPGDPELVASMTEVRFVPLEYLDKTLRDSIRRALLLSSCVISQSS